MAGVSISLYLRRRYCPLSNQLYFRKVRSEDAKISWGETLGHDHLSAAFILDPSCSLRSKYAFNHQPARPCSRQGVGPILVHFGGCHHCLCSGREYAHLFHCAFSRTPKYAESPAATRQQHH